MNRPILLFTLSKSHLKWLKCNQNKPMQLAQPQPWRPASCQVVCQIVSTEQTTSWAALESNSISGLVRDDLKASFKIKKKIAVIKYTLWTKLMNQMDCMNKMTCINLMDQTNQINQINQMDVMNYMYQMKQVNQTNQINQMNWTNWMKQKNQTH